MEINELLEEFKSLEKRRNDAKRSYREVKTEFDVIQSRKDNLVRKEMGLIPDLVESPSKLLELFQKINQMGDE